MTPEEREVYWTALTVLMEAAGEPYEGKLAVAYVIRNRARAQRVSRIDVVLAPMQFSCWNSNSPTRRMVARAEENPAWPDCVRAARTTLLNVDDPTKGANHYLNVQAVRKARHRLPSWYDVAKVTAVIGRHTFLKL